MMKGIYRDIQHPDHVVKVINRDADSISYEDGEKIVCTKRVKSFDSRYKRDDAASVAAMASGYNVAAAK
jgi:hypothetical protein